MLYDVRCYDVYKKKFVPLLCSYEHFSRRLIFIDPLPRVPDIFNASTKIVSLVLFCPPPPHTYHYNGFSLLKNTIFLFYMKSFFQMFCIFAPAHVLRSNRMLMWMARPPRTYYRHNCAPFLVHALMRCILPVQLYKHYLIKNEKIPPYHISYYLT